MPNALKMATAKSRKLTRADKLAINNAGKQALVQELEEMEHRAHSLGLTITARALNNAKNAAGWEMAGDSHRADMATRGER